MSGSVVAPVVIRTIIATRWLVIVTGTVVGKRFFAIATPWFCRSWP